MGKCTGCRNIIIISKNAAQYPVKIPIHRRKLASKTNAVHSGCGIFSYSFQRQNIVIFLWKNPSEIFHNLMRSLMNIERTGIIPESFPMKKHFIRRSFCQSLHVGKTIYEPMIMVKSLLYSGLLKNNFADPDFVWILCLSERKISSVY